MSVKKLTVGTWIRFYRNAKLVIGVIEYVKEAHISSSARWIYQTSEGEVNDKDVIEAREPKESK